MKTVKANDVRIPASAREALARHEEVVVLSHDRPAYVIVNPEDYGRPSPPSRRGRPLGEALEILSKAPLPDSAFGRDMEAVLKSVGPMPRDPWEPS